jgi:predicted Rossmann fold flavoprotein
MSNNCPTIIQLLSRIAIIGAGAAGCFAAANIPSGHEVVVFEKASKAMQKVKVSGGGRCNVTHACYDIPELVKRYPRGTSLLKRSLYQFGPQDTIDWFEKRGVAIKEEADGRMFPTTDDSQTIIDCIWAAMMRSNVQVRFGKGVKTVLRTEQGWELVFDDTSTYQCDKVLLASGSIQKPEQWSWLTSLGHTIQPPAPSLFTFNLPDNPITQLMGVSVPDVTVKLAGIKGTQSGPILITHWGLSGPAILKTSAWAARALQEKKYECTVLINWLKDVSESDLRAEFQELRQSQGKSLVGGKNPFGLPKRLWEFMLQRSGVSEQVRWGELTSTAQQKLLTSLVADAYQMKGKTTFKEEFVTCGGVTTSEINAQTMESRIAPGLFFAGEAMDVDGITGGYNFQHAWSSGWIAAKNMSA